MKGKTTWILVANGTNAYIAENRGPGQGIEKNLVHEFQCENMPNREIMSDVPGRTFDSGGKGRHALEPATDPQRSSKHTFATEIAAHLDKAAERKEFDRLVVIAAPQMLGELRHSLSRAAIDRVTGELPKDLTHLPVHKLPRHLEEIMVV